MQCKHISFKLRGKTSSCTTENVLISLQTTCIVDRGRFQLGGRRTNSMCHALCNMHFYIGNYFRFVQIDSACVRPECHSNHNGTRCMVPNASASEWETCAVNMECIEVYCGG